ncbi:MAG: hypothetical protein H7A25_19115 [Leptospiraceae bacterium]|nr:hypothetical protein [Leptospiraceae bacterium]
MVIENMVDKTTLKKISTIKTLDDWITFTIKSDLSAQKKGYLTKIWLKDNNFSKADLDAAKKHNEFWKERASKNTLTRRRKLETPGNLSKAGKPWTEVELAKLKENIDKPEKELIKLFKRSLQSINSKKKVIRMQLMGIDVDNTGKSWSKKDIEKLKKNIDKPNIELAKMFKRTTQSIQGKKKELRNKAE